MAETNVKKEIDGEAVYKYQYVTVAEAAKYLRFTPARVYQWLESGELPGRKVHSSWRIPSAAVRALLGEE